MFVHSSNPQVVVSRGKDKKLYRGIHQDPRVIGSKEGQQHAQNNATWLRTANPASNVEVRTLLRNVLRTPVDISANLVERQAHNNTVDTECQTAAFLPRPEPPPYIPKKTGVDRATQIEPEDRLFDFDAEVEPILQIIVSKTLEQSLQEVNRGAELEHLGKTKKYYGRVKEDIRREQLEFEKKAIKKLHDKEQRKVKEAARLERELVVCEKVAACSRFQSLIGADLQREAFRHLEEADHFPNELRDAITKDFLPWVYDKVGTTIDSTAVCRMLSDQLIRSALARRKEGALAYRKAIQDRKDAERNAVLKLQEEQRLLEEAKLRKEEEKRNRINVMMNASGQSLGPVLLSQKDSVSEAEVKIAMWLAVNDVQLDRPENGYLEYALQPLDEPAAQLLADVTQLVEALPLVTVPVEADEGEEGEEAPE